MAVQVPRLSIAAKLYAIFVLMAMGAVALHMAIDANEPLWVSTLLGLAILAAGAAAVAGVRDLSKPLGALARMTETIAAGPAEVAIPYRDRQDEIGALARAMAVFQQVLRNNAELNRTVSDESEGKARRQSAMIAEIAR